MPTVALTIHIPDALQEFLIAELSDLDFDTFEQHDQFMVAYIPTTRWNDVAREGVEMWMARHGLRTPITEEVIADQNWNRTWEKTVQPVAVEPFLIRPTWHETPPDHADLILLEIDPKMSFGTGYHESTRLLLRMLPDYVESGSFVLDAGTGTGILAVAAIKLGASSAIAFDIDPWSQDNAVENFYLNGVVDRVEMRPGSIELVDEKDFDVILANINYNVIAGLLPNFAGKLAEDGSLLVSGILSRDRDRILTTASRRGLRLRDEREENEWWLGVFALFE